MKKVMAVLAVVVAIAFLGATVADANQCPLLVKQLKDAAAKEKDPKKKAAIEKGAKEAEDLHAKGDHSASVQKAQDTAKAAGIKLEMKKS